MRSLLPLLGPKIMMSYTSEVLGKMLDDIKPPKDNPFEPPAGIETTPIVGSRGVWPIGGKDVDVQLKLSDTLGELSGAFEKYYRGLHANRSLIWLHEHSTCYIEGGTYNSVVSRSNRTRTTTGLPWRLGPVLPSHQ